VKKFSGKTLKNMGLILAFILLVVSLPACSQPENQPVPSTNITTDKLIPIEDIDRGNLKLDYILVQLIEAEKRGKADSFALQRDITLRGSSVLVDIRCVPGQIEAAASAAIRMGAKLASSLNSPDGFSAIVPITSLEALAKEKSIAWIAIPVPVDFGSN
jgi:hypothetical protein